MENMRQHGCFLGVTNNTLCVLVGSCRFQNGSVLGIAYQLNPTTNVRHPASCASEATAGLYDAEKGITGYLKAFCFFIRIHIQPYVFQSKARTIHSQQQSIYHLHKKSYQVRKPYRRTSHQLQLT